MTWSSTASSILPLCRQCKSGQNRGEEPEEAEEEEEAEEPEEAEGEEERRLAIVDMP
eukprot:COSAG06_NODE_2654_length_6488_cov_4.182658_7_plen_57_part_00